MEKISIKPKMSKINLNCMSFEIKLSMKGDIFRARSSSLAKIANVKVPDLKHLVNIHMKVLFKI